MSPNFRLIRSPMLAVLACGALGSLAVADRADSATTKSCKIDQNGKIVYLPDNSGNVYYVRVTNTTCAVANKVVLGFFHCRRANGKRGTCRKPVVGFTCTEGKRRYTELPSGEKTDYAAIVSCTKGSQRVVHSYRQNL